MPSRKKDEDFNTQIHAIYERISAGGSSHDEPAPEPEPTKPEKTPKREKVFDPKKEPAKWLGQRGGMKGGKTRIDRMTPEQRTALAKKAAEARWGKK